MSFIYQHLFSLFAVVALCVYGALSTITKHGLIIVDIQYDFASPSGSLTVFPGGTNAYLGITSAQYIDRINSYLALYKDDYDFIAFSIDYHSLGHCSFASTLANHGFSVNAYDSVHIDDHANDSWTSNVCVSQTGNQVLWPDHCVPQMPGSRFMEDLYDIRPVAHVTSDADLRRVVIWRDGVLDEEYVTNYATASTTGMPGSFKDELDHVQAAQLGKTGYAPVYAEVSQVMYVFKGRDLLIDSYSVFDGNDGITPTGLYDALNAYDYTPDNTDLTVFGIAYDYCVTFTSRDAAEHGYHVTVLDQLTAPVFPADVPALIIEMENLGMTISYEYGNVTNGDEYGGDDGDDGDDKANAQCLSMVTLFLCSLFALIF